MYGKMHVRVLTMIWKGGGRRQGQAGGWEYKSDALVKTATRNQKLNPETRTHSSIH